MRPPVRGLLAVAALLLLLGAAVAFHQATGPRPIGWSGLWQAVWAFDPMNFDHQTVMALRLPRLLAAFLAGAALGMAGVLLQSLLRNPLGEPHILGLNAGASLAVVVCLAFPLGVFSAPLLRPVVAATGGGLAFLLVLLLSSAGRLGLTMTKVTFCGIAVSALASTLTSGVLLLDEETLATVRLWLLGDAAAGTWTTVRAAAPLLLLALLAGWALAARLNVLALGDALATSLGVSLLKTRLLGLVVVAVLCGGAVSMVGPVGFIGLMVPAMARRLSSLDHRALLPRAAVLGGIMLIVADAVARWLLAPRELATGVMTALVGAPVFVLIVARRMKE
ncbi:FecCD family ABC transporter permease [Insolitispirillum peregrinum]|uniref:FecCD family ABC transporter permease n=1 Tax=Insolitispirillum peregrinum TaxID=80876 RepID=UPI0009709852|nr:iron ABC transporter permease [Insolitispirillum peregrinum]